MIDDEKLDDAAGLANELIDFADFDDDGVAAMACLMAAATFLVWHGTEIGHAARILKVLMKGYAADHPEITTKGKLND